MQRRVVRLILGAIVALNAAFTMASEGERADFASVSVLMRHQIAFAGIPGCDINLERVAGSVGVGLYESWKATAVGSCPPDPVYEFSLRGVGETAFAMKRDFATKGSVVDSLMRTSWVWTPMIPGDYQVRVVLKATYGSPSSERVEVVSDPINVPTPALNVPRASSHPLVALYTTQDRRCTTLAVRFQKNDDSDVDQPWQLTNSQRCSGSGAPPKTFFVAGMEASTTYKVQLVVDGHPFQRVERFTTGAIPANVHVNETSTDPLRDPLHSFVRAVDALTDTSIPFHWDVFNRPVWIADSLIGTPMVKTIAGQPVWYWHLASAASELNNPIVPRKTELKFLAFARDANSPPAASNAALTVYREIDMAGMPLWETNLRALDQRASHRQFGFHHDAQRVGEMDRLLTTYTARCKRPNVPAGTANDPGDDPDVNASWLPVCPCTRAGCDATRTATWFGDGLLLVKNDGSIAWEWNIFDYLATNRPAPNVYPVCAAATGECPLLGMREYTHSNSIGFSADNSILLLSVRFQDWVLAIDFRDGKGTGDVLWRLGRSGDFSCVIHGGDPCPTFDPWQDTLGEPPQNDPWFSHQHTAHFLGADRVLLFDNGNRRCTAAGPTADWTCNGNGIRSRMQLYHLEFNGSGAPLQAVRERNVVLVRYSSALGTAQLLSNGNLVGGLGNIPIDGTATATRVSYVEEIGTDPYSFLPVQSYTYVGREPLGDAAAVGGRSYRAPRVRSLYTSSPP
jgi:hypothetical protein